MAKIDAPAVETVKELYFFPELGVSVEATNPVEAKKLAEQKVKNG